MELEGEMKKIPEIPIWMRELPNNAVIGREEIYKIYGMNGGSLKQYIDRGTLPKPDFMVKRSGGHMAYKWKLGAIRKAIKVDTNNAEITGG